MDWQEINQETPVISMDALPDDVLLSIFNSYLDEYSYAKEREEAWQLLVHVCRQWRSIVFGSPRHLNMQLVCTTRTSARDTLDVWPVLPLVIKCHNYYPIRNVDNIIAALERKDRVCRIDLVDIQSPNLETILATMQQPFPVLRSLLLWSYKGTVPVIPDSFLGGSVPHLESLSLGSVPFPGLPKLLLSATHLRFLRLNIPYSTYISPDAMITVLSTLTSLEELTFGFQFPQSCPNRATRHPPPSTLSVLPVLTFFRFKGASKYLEDLVARIDTPQLNELSIVFFSDLVFDTPLFMQFISRTPILKPLEKAHITFWDEAAYVNFLPRTSWHRSLNVEILCRGLDWQVSSLEQFFTSRFPPLSMSEDLYIYKRPGWPLKWKDNTENVLWVELLRPFTGVKNLYLREEFARRIGSALQELTEGRTTKVLEVLPALENIFLDVLDFSGSVEEGIARFVAGREVAGHPIAISCWDSSGKEKFCQYYSD